MKTTFTRRTTEGRPSACCGRRRPKDQERAQRMPLLLLLELQFGLEQPRAARTMIFLLVALVILASAQDSDLLTAATAETTKCLWTGLHCNVEIGGTHWIDTTSVDYTHFETGKSQCNSAYQRWMLCDDGFWHSGMINLPSFAVNCEILTSTTTQSPTTPSMISTLTSTPPTTTPPTTTPSTAALSTATTSGITESTATTTANTSASDCLPIIVTSADEMNGSTTLDFIEHPIAKVFCQPVQANDTVNLWENGEDVGLYGPTVYRTFVCNDKSQWIDTISMRVVSTIACAEIQSEKSLMLPVEWSTTSSLNLIE